MIGSTLGERFLFTPSLAFCIAVPFFVRQFASKPGWGGKNILLGITAVIVVLFSMKTFSRNKDWKDNFSLFLSGVEAAPNSSRAQSAAGSAYREMAEKEQESNKRIELFQKALVYYKKAIEILPENTEALYNAGVSYYGMGDKENALKMYEMTLKVSPEYSNAANNAGVIYFERQEYEKAKKYFLQALTYSPNNADALGNLGAVEHNTGNIKKAIEYYKKSLLLNPSNQNVRNNLAKAEKAMGSQ
jgi:tetratricopeptide (TPR) repeat protein